MAERAAGAVPMIISLGLLAYLAAFAFMLAYGPTRHDRALGVVFRPLILLVMLAVLWALTTGLRPARRRG